MGSAADWAQPLSERAGEPLRLLDCADQPTLPTLRLLDSSLRGLDEAEAQERLLRRPPAPSAGPPHWPHYLAATAANPFVLVLAGLSLVSVLTHDVRGALLIAFLALLSCGLRVRQEYRSDRAAAALRAMVTTTATVLRRSSPDAPPMAREVPIDQVVPGDVVRLGPGDLIPADLRLLLSDDLRVSQAVLTGESFPVEKYATLTGPTTTGVLFNRPELCFMGTEVVSGSGTAVAVATGAATYFGATHADPPGRRPETAFDRGVRSVSWTLIAFMVAAIPLVLVATGLIRGEWQQALAFATAAGVAVTPEMLPLVVTTVQVRGATSLARRQVIVKRLPAVHNLGAMDTLCTDKTGTLTLDRITLACHLDAHGNPDPAVLDLARANAHWMAELTGALVGDAIDEALRDTEPDGDLTGVAVIPFDATRRRATVVVRRRGLLGRDLLITKGAVPDVLAVCSHVDLGDAGEGPPAPLDAAGRARLAGLADAHAEQGIRLLAVATAERRATGRHYAPEDERDLTFAGFVGFRNEPDPSAASTLAALADLGVCVVMLTGDDPLVARRAARDVGLPDGPVLLGTDLDALGEADPLPAGVRIFARVDPQQKAQVVRALRAAGRTVGFLGDGLNDAPALRAADVGISVRGAVQAARESSDVILADRRLPSLVAAVIHGRRTFGNAVKYIKISVTNNVGNLLSMLVAGALLPFLPMLPLQVLVQNLFSDMAQLGLAFDRVDERDVAGPRTFDPRDLVRFVVLLGPIGTLFDLATFAGLWWLLDAHGSHAARELFRSGWFAENLVAQALAILLLRSRGLGRGGPLPTWPVLAAAALIGLGGLALPFSPVAGVLGFVPLPGETIPLLVSVVVGYTVLTVTVRAACVRTWRRWL